MVNAIYPMVLSAKSMTRVYEHISLM